MSISYKAHISLRITLFVLLVIFISAGVGILINSVNYRYQRLQQSIDFAKIALFQSQSDSEQAKRKLLQYVGARALSMKNEEEQKYFTIEAGIPPIPQKTFFLEDETPWQQFVHTFIMLIERNDSIIRVIGKGFATKDDYEVEAFIFERPIRDAIRLNILQSSTFSVLMAALVALVILTTIYFTLTSPLLLLKEALMRYKQNPSNMNFILAQSPRLDEIGAIHNEFSDLQKRVYITLKRQDRLAGIGSAVTKISHDLRSTIGTVSILLDELKGKNSDPAFIHEIEAIFQTLDRAVNLCSDTLSYAKKQNIDYHLSWESLRRLLNRKQEDLDIHLHIPEKIMLHIDPLHFQRVYVNLLDNAKQAGATRMEISCEPISSSDLQEPILTSQQKMGTTENGSSYLLPENTSLLQILIVDNGPGFSEKGVENLFQPFTGTTKVNGNGLGLPLSREIIYDLGGTFDLLSTGDSGSTFQITFPDSLYKIKST